MRIRIAVLVLLAASTVAYAVKWELVEREHDAARARAFQDLVEARRKEKELLQPLGPTPYSAEERKRMAEAIERARRDADGGTAQAPCNCTPGDPICSCF